MAVYFFLWNPKKDPYAFHDFDRVQRDARAGQPYLTDWICPSTRPEPGDTAVLQRTGPTNNGVFATGTVIAGAFRDDDGTRCVRLSLDSFLPLGREIPRAEIVRRAGHDGNWCPMASGNVVPEPIARAIHALWDERVGEPDTAHGS